MSTPLEGDSRVDNKTFRAACGSMYISCQFWWVKLMP